MVMYNHQYIIISSRPTDHEYRLMKFYCTTICIKKKVENLDSNYPKENLFLTLIFGFLKQKLSVERSKDIACSFNNTF